MRRLRPYVPDPAIEARRVVIRGVRRARAEWPLRALQLGRLGTLDYQRRGALVGRMIDVHEHIQCAHTHGEMVRTLIPGGVLFSHDGHLPVCIDVLRDSRFWAAIPGPAPIITGLGAQKLVSIRNRAKRCVRTFSFTSARR